MEEVKNVISKPYSKILGFSFNQSRTFLTTATDTGFTMYQVDPLEKICERDMGGGIGIAVQLFETNFFGLVGGGKNQKFPTCKFVLWDDYKGEQVVEIVMKDRIVSVKLNHDVIAIVTSRHVKLVSIKTVQEIMKIKTHPNPDGVCALSSLQNKSIFLCPGVTPGTVNIVDYDKGTQRMVSCHEHPIKWISMNTSFDKSQDPFTDSIFATASDHGTLIKVFDIEKQTKLNEFRRGGDATEIYGLEFSRDSRCLATTSSKGTVHVYSLSKDFGNVSSRASILGGVASYFGSQWSPFSIDFSATMKAKQPNKDFQRHVASVSPIIDSKNPNTPTDHYRLLIISEDGCYAVHDLQFKDTKSVHKVSGLLQDLVIKPPMSTTDSEADIDYSSSLNKIAK